MSIFRRSKRYEQESFHRVGDVRPVRNTSQFRMEEALSPGASFNFKLGEGVEFYGEPYTFVMGLRHIVGMYMTVNAGNYTTRTYWQPDVEEGAVRDLKLLVKNLERGDNTPVRLLVAAALRHTFEESLSNRGTGVAHHGFVTLEASNSGESGSELTANHLGALVSFTYPVAAFDSDGAPRMVESARIGVLKRLDKHRVWLTTDSGVRVFKRERVRRFQTFADAQSGTMAYFRVTLAPSTEHADAAGRWDYLGSEHPRSVLPTPERSREGLSALLRRLDTLGLVAPLPARALPKMKPKVEPEKPPIVEPKPVPKPDPWRQASWDELVSLRGKTAAVRVGATRDSPVHWMRFVAVELEGSDLVLIRGRDGAQLRASLDSLQVPL